MAWMNAVFSYSVKGWEGEWEILLWENFFYQVVGS